MLSGFVFAGSDECDAVSGFNGKNEYSFSVDTSDDKIEAGRRRKKGHRGRRRGGSGLR
tara:strand:+ start:408 stop:581 length:174 start_codon:yes stop_codon:yes gene_type:complete